MAMISATPAEVPVPLFSLRPLDIAELQIAGLDPILAIDQCVAASTESWLVNCPDGVMCVWGYRLDSSGADVWLLTSALVERYPILFVRESRRLLQILLAEIPILRCDVWAEYPQAIAWLTRLGFEATGWHKPGFLHMIRTSNGRA